MAGRRAALRRELSYLLLLAPAVVYLLALFFYPLAGTLLRSVTEPGWTLQHYVRFLSDPLYLQVTLITFRLSLWVTLACLLLGYPVAYLVWEARPSRQDGLLFLVVLALWVSLLVRNYAWMTILRSNGLLNSLLLWTGLIETPLKLMHNEIGVIIGMTHYLLPYMILPIYAALNNIEPSLRKAAHSLGAGEGQVFLRVTLPLSLPGVGAGSLFVFLLSVGFYVTPALLGGPKQLMLSNFVDMEVREFLNWPFGAAIAVVLLGSTLAIFFVYQRFLGLQRLWGRG